LATLLLASAFNPHLFPTGFRIRSSIIAFSFSHENSFVPMYARSEWSFKGDGGMMLSYWDDKAYVKDWMPSGTAASKVIVEKKVEKVQEKDSEADMEAFFDEIEKEVVVGGFVPPPPPPSLTSLAGSVPTIIKEPEVQVVSGPLLAGPGVGAGVPLAGTDEERLKVMVKSRLQGTSYPHLD
jgi:hypothetical protein